MIPPRVVFVLRYEVLFRVDIVKAIEKRLHTSVQPLFFLFLLFLFFFAIFVNRIF